MTRGGGGAFSSTVTVNVTEGFYIKLFCPKQDTENTRVSDPAAFDYIHDLFSLNYGFGSWIRKNFFKL